MTLRLPAIAFSIVCLFSFATLIRPAAAESVPLFDGKTLDGWESPSPELWRVVDGKITGGDGVANIAHNDFLCTTKSYQNFVLTLEIRLTGDPARGMINSGIQIRSARIPGDPEVSGYQCDWGDPTWWGGIYDESRRNRLIAAADMEKIDPVLRRDGWNQYVIRAEGPRIRTSINGVLAVDYTEEDPKIALDGILGVQIHSGGNAMVEVKNIEIEELPPTPGAPTWGEVGRPGENADASKNAQADGPAMKLGNAPDADRANNPAEELATFTLPDGFVAELVAAEDPEAGIGKFVPIVFDRRGALWTTTALEYPVDGNENPAAADALYESHAKDKILIYDRDPSTATGFAAKPRVFAEGLAIPLGVLPFGNGCYVQHGHDIAFLEDTDGDGKADRRSVVLTGFGVQDSHLFPHQFTRAPGGWLWMAQGAFNYSQVRRPGAPESEAVTFDQTRMAKFRPDGAEFDITSNGPCNIWGLVMNGEGETFIQEANDFGYPVMPFEEYANYPGCSDAQWKPYAPEFPSLARDFRMGGTGLSGLALTDAEGPFPEKWRDVMLIANPITNRIQAIRMTRDGASWNLAPPEDFLVSSDPWFRPVAITMGPDGCLYIVDWYNRIISHNEVPRNHPERDKTRGRIWRVKATAQPPLAVPNFAELAPEALIPLLGGQSLTASHLAWQELADRADEKTLAKLRKIVADESLSSAKRIQALWVLRETEQLDPAILSALLASEQRNLRVEVVRAVRGEPTLLKEFSLESLVDDADPRVRAEAIRAAATRLAGEATTEAFTRLLDFAKAPLAGPLETSTHNGKMIKTGIAYDREFERYLIRRSLEQHPVELAEFMESSGESLSLEAQLLAALALDPVTGASRIAKALPQLDRVPEAEEVLRLVGFPEAPGVAAALGRLLTAPTSREQVLEELIAARTRLDAAKTGPLLAAIAADLLDGDAAAQQLGVRLAAAFGMRELADNLARILRKGTTERESQLHLTAAARESLVALRELQIGEPREFLALARSAATDEVRLIALEALASSTSGEAAPLLLSLYPQLEFTPRRVALTGLSSTRAGAAAIVSALQNGTIAKDEISATLLDRILTQLPPDGPALDVLAGILGTAFREVLKLDGSEEAWTHTGIRIEGACTFETWIRLDPEGREISNADGIFGFPGQLDINFAAALPRVYRFPPQLDVVICPKPIAPGIWTHIAATRDEAGVWSMYFDGELIITGDIESPGVIENVRLGWTSTPGGTRGMISDARIWNRARTASEILASNDRSLPHDTPGLVFSTADGSWGQREQGAHVIRTADFPPVLTDAEARELDEKYARLRKLAALPGDAETGSLLAESCRACHLMGDRGSEIGPNLGGIGAMGTEGIARNLLQPNAAMENGYRIFRVELKDGGILDARFVSETSEAIIVRMPGADDRRIPRTDILSTTFLRRSLMPDGLTDGMTDQQVSDLFAYLRTLE